MRPNHGRLRTPLDSSVLLISLNYRNNLMDNNRQNAYLKALIIDSPDLITLMPKETDLPIIHIFIQTLK